LGITSFTFKYRDVTVHRVCFGLKVHSTSYHMSVGPLNPKVNLSRVYIHAFAFASGQGLDSVDCKYIPSLRPHGIVCGQRDSFTFLLLLENCTFNKTEKIHII